MPADLLKASLAYRKRPNSTTPYEPMAVVSSKGSKEEGSGLLALFPPTPMPNEQPLKFTEDEADYEIKRAFTTVSGVTRCTFTVKMTVPVT